MQYGHVRVSQRGSQILNAPCFLTRKVSHFRIAFVLLQSGDLLAIPVLFWAHALHFLLLQNPFNSVDVQLFMYTIFNSFLLSVAIMVTVATSSELFLGRYYCLLCVGILCNFVAHLSKISTHPDSGFLNKSCSPSPWILSYPLLWYFIAIFFFN